MELEQGKKAALEKEPWLKEMDGNESFPSFCYLCLYLGVLAGLVSKGHRALGRKLT